MIAALLGAVLLFSPPPVLDLDDVLDEVGRAAPAVEVDRAAVAAARAAVGVAGAWEDPRVTIMGEGFPFSGTAEGRMLSYSLSQELNLFGRRGARKRAARARTTGREAALRRTAWDARAQAAALFFELWMSQETAAVLDGQLDLMRRMRQAALDRVRAGMEMGHHDVLRADAEIARMEAERVSLDDERAAMAVMLNTLRGRGDDDSVPRVRLPAAAAVPPPRELVARAAQTPEVAAARAMREEAEAERALAGKMYLPMVMVEGTYQQQLDGMRDTWGAAVMFSVPLWFRDRQRNEVAMADAMIARAEREERAMRQMASAELRMAWSRVRAEVRRVEALEKSAIPSLQESVRSTESAYAAGRADFLVLLEALVTLRELEMKRLEAVARREIARFELDRIAARETSGGPR